VSRAVAKGGIILVETPVIVQVLSCPALVLARVCSSSSPARTRRWMEALEQTMREEPAEAAARRAQTNAALHRARAIGQSASAARVG
jgi:hypothetical protein